MPAAQPSSPTPAGAGFRRGPRSLRTRLLASYALVIGLALGLALLLTVGSLAREGRRAQEEQLAALAVPLSVQAAVLGRRPPFAPAVRDRVLAEAFGRQAAEIGARVVLLDGTGRVRLDTAPGAPLVGSVPESLRAPAEIARRVAAAERGVETVPVEPSAALQTGFPDERVVVAAASPLGGDPAVLAVSAPTATPAVVARLAGRFAIASLVALSAAAAVAVAVSRRLAAPLTALSAAADRMAAGELRQQVPGGGPDELGRLVASFNAMSDRVAAADRSQRALLANVAHDLRTPLTSIRGYARALADGAASDPRDRAVAVATIEGESARMGRLIADLLDLARLESGQVDLDLQSLPVAGAFADAVARVRPMAAERRIAIESSADSGLAILADRDRFAQVLGNLLDNALRHTPPGGRVLLAATAAAEVVRMEVRDTGPGMDAVTRERAFGRFVRGVASGPTGSGLGLAIVREIVTAHGGTARIESAEGQGTAVILRWPVPTARNRSQRR